MAIASFVIFLWCAVDLLPTVYFLQMYKRLLLLYRVVDGEGALPRRSCCGLGKPIVDSVVSGASWHAGHLNELISHAVT
jgi:hypothetical protein